MNATIGKTKIIEKIIDKMDIQEALVIPERNIKSFIEKIVDNYHDVLLEALVEGDRVLLKNLFTYEVVTRAERQGKDLNTGEPITYPPIKSVKCKVSRVVKNAINADIADEIIEKEDDK